jgi:hypothetical protein
LIVGSGPGAFGFLTGDPLAAFPSYQGIGVSQPLYTEVLGGGVGIGGITELLGGFDYTLAPFKDAGYSGRAAALARPWR